jgi:CRISPR-associated exonuclease Cas4
VPTLIILLAVAGLALLWLAGRTQSRSGLPRGRVVYLDPASLRAAPEPLYDARLDLAGRPDYLVATPRGLIPVESKSGRAPLQPHDSQLLQLAAYCRLVQGRQDQRPPYGILKYADRAVQVAFTGALEERLLDTLAEIRRAELHMPDRSHESAGRCRACGYREQCDQRLG